MRKSYSRMLLFAVVLFVVPASPIFAMEGGDGGGGNQSGISWVGLGESIFGCALGLGAVASYFGIEAYRQRLLDTARQDGIEEEEVELQFESIKEVKSLSDIRAFVGERMTENNMLELAKWGSTVVLGGTGVLLFGDGGRRFIYKLWPRDGGAPAPHGEGVKEKDKTDVDGSKPSVDGDGDGDEPKSPEYCLCSY